MDKNLYWIKEKIEDGNGKYEKITCPFLLNGLCSIYDDRPLCCKSYPQKDAYCTSIKCNISNSNLDGKKELFLF